MKSKYKLFALVAVTATAAAALTGCSTSSGASTTSSKASITVSIDTGLTKDATAQIAARVKQFEKANPDIKVTATPYDWTATTFAAQLAGGTLPNVFTIPVTDGPALIAQKQIADVSDLVSALPYAKNFNPAIIKNGENSTGGIEALPIGAYGQALYYNRDLFTKAGLDPDKPPTTWAQVRADAKAISDKTGEPGYVTMTQSNTGGWILTSLANAMGGGAESKNGKKATVDSPAFTKALTMLKNMRWEDNSMGSNFLLDWNGINQAFAAGKAGMFISGGGNYTSFVQQNAIDPNIVGESVLPLSGSGAGALGGGTLAVVSTKSSKAQQAAAVKWIDYYYLSQQFSKSASISAAKIAVAAKQPVGVPEVPVFDKATYLKTLVWTKPYVNVPLDQFTPYTSKEFSQAIIPEPAVQTQAVYGQLDPVVQAVLTNKDANIGSLLSTANASIQSLLDSGN
jgi:ABC-type glycerol-3-phosphate transport system substrate-binding protein